MDWRIKCLAFHLIEALPGGDALYRAAQRHVTKRYFRTLRPDAVTDPESSHQFHVRNYLRLGRPGIALEFGAGGSLSTALMLSGVGATVYAYDIEQLANPEKVNHMIRNLREIGAQGSWSEINSLDELETKYRIHYYAPGDVRDTKLPSGSVDYIYSMSCLEHIPPDDIADILSECKRIASDEALLSFWICYFDHYATADKTISRCNFYQFSDDAWRFWNPKRHYQNRLRHCDFENLFAEFEMVSNERILCDSSALDGIKIDSKFAHYSREDLLTVMGKFLLRCCRQ